MRGCRRWRCRYAARWRPRGWRWEILRHAMLSRAMPWRSAMPRSRAKCGAGRCSERRPHISPSMARPCCVRQRAMKGLGLAGRDAGLLRLLAGIDLDIADGVPSELVHLGLQALGERVAIDALDDVEQRQCLADLVGLQGADEMQDDIGMARLDRRPFRLRLLHAVLAEAALSRGDGFENALGPYASSTRRRARSRPDCARRRGAAAAICRRMSARSRGDGRTQRRHSWLPRIARPAARQRARRRKHQAVATAVVSYPQGEVSCVMLHAARGPIARRGEIEAARRPLVAYDCCPSNNGRPMLAPGSVGAATGRVILKNAIKSL